MAASKTKYQIGVIFKGSGMASEGKKKLREYSGRSYSEAHNHASDYVSDEALIIAVGLI